MKRQPLSLSTLFRTLIASSLIIGSAHAQEREELFKFRDLHIKAPRTAGATSKAATSGAYPTQFGSAKLAIVLFNLVQKNNDGTTTIYPSALTHDSAVDAFFTGSTSVRSVFESSSYGQMTFDSDGDKDGAPDVFGPFDLPITSVGCEERDILPMLDAEINAVAGIVDLSRYNNVGFVTRRVKNIFECDWIGVVYSGGEYQKYANYNVGTARPESGGWNAVGVLAHELGHTIGLQHAAIDTNNDQVITSSDEEYGDYSCNMSNLPVDIGFNAVHRLQIGWFDAFANRVGVVSKPGRYQAHLVDLDLYPGSTSEFQSIIINTEGTYKAKRGREVPYVLSYKPAQSALSRLFDGDTARFKDGISIHRAQSVYEQSLLITSLTDGGKFYDQDAAITITQVGRSGDGIDITIDVKDLTQEILNRVKSPLSRLKSFALAQKAPKSGKPLQNALSRLSKLQKEVVASIHSDSKAGVSITSEIQSITNAVKKLLKAKRSGFKKAKASVRVKFAKVERLARG